MAQSIVSLLECPVCLDKFVDPRILTPCLHTLCYKCLQSHITQTGQNGQFQCPECRGTMPIPEDGADSFRKNFFINHCLDVVVQPETGARSKTGQRAGQGVKQTLCDNSEEGDDCGDRENFCLECCEYYCNNCSKAHRKSKVSRGHILVPLKDLTDEMFREATSKSKAPRCMKHVDKLLELYCSTCQHAVCYLCSRTDHQTHICQDISDVDKDLKTELNEIIASLQRLIKDSQKVTTEMNRSQQVIENSTTTARVTATRVFKKMQQTLTKKAEEIDQNICEIKEEGVSMFASQLKNQTLQTELLQSLCTFVQDLLMTGTVYNRLASLPDVRSRLQEFHVPPSGGATQTETTSSTTLVAKQLDGLVLQEEVNLGGPGSEGLVLEMKYICSIKPTTTRHACRDRSRGPLAQFVDPGGYRPPAKLKVLLYVSGLFMSILDLVDDAVRSMAFSLDCYVTETTQTPLKPAETNTMDIVGCWGNEINSVVQRYQLDPSNTASRHLVLIHQSRGGSLEETLQSLGDCRGFFQLVVQYDWDDTNSCTAAVKRLAKHFREVGQYQCTIS